MKQSFFASFICDASNYEQLFANNTASRQVKSTSDENPHQNPEHCSALNNGCIPMKQSFFASFMYGASNSEQLLNTELHQDSRNQLLTKFKTLTKIQKALIGAK